MDMQWSGCEQALVFFRFSEGSARERRAAKPREARNERGSLRRKKPLQSPAFSHARGHLRVSHVLLDGLRKKRDARSLCSDLKKY